MTQPVVKHFNVNTQPPDLTVGHSKKFVPSRDVLRKWAREATGARAFCFFCGLTFGTAYMKQIKIKLFEIDWVCKDCREERHL